jgi:hypothetical protein
MASGKSQKVYRRKSGKSRTKVHRPKTRRSRKTKKTKSRHMRGG